MTKSDEKKVEVTKDPQSKVEEVKVTETKETPEEKPEAAAANAEESKETPQEDAANEEENKEEAGSEEGTKEENGEEADKAQAESHSQLQAEKRLAHVEELLEKAAEQITALATASVQKQQAPAEGTADDTNKETPKDDAEKPEDKKEAPAAEEKPTVEEPAKPAAEEANKEEAKETTTDDANAQKVEKSETSSEGAKLDALLKSIEDLKKDTAERLKKLEDMPAPSKPVVFTKSFGAEDEDTKSELEKIDNRLSEIKTLKSEHPEQYTTAHVDEALSLINKRDQLNGLI